MAKFNLEEYNTVADRVLEFRKDHPNGFILTEMLVDDGKRIVMRAEAYFNDNPEEPQVHPNGVGHAEEIRGDGYINKTSTMENCESSAWGRALAACGYSTRKIASVEEVTIAKNKEKQLAQKPAQQEDPEASDKKALAAIAKRYAKRNSLGGDLKQQIVTTVRDAGVAVKSTEELTGETLTKAVEAVRQFEKNDFQTDINQQLEGLVEDRELVPLD